MNINSKKSLADFKGQALPIDQQTIVKGGDHDLNLALDFIVMDDFLDG